MGVLLIEARDRLGGRAWTIADGLPCPFDVGCGWLHSADLNPWVAIAERQGKTIDRAPPPWSREAGNQGYGPDLQAEFAAAADAFYERLERAREEPHDRAAVEFLEPGCRWNPLLEAVSSYYNGAPLGRVSVRDFGEYLDTGINWRVREGYGAAVTAHAEGVPLALGCPVSEIDHSGRRLRLATARGTVEARAAIVTVSSNLLAKGAIRFRPALPDKQAAAAGLPLGHAAKLLIGLDRPEAVPERGRLFGGIDRAATGTYHLRPFGQPVIEGYFGGDLAAQLDLAGPAGLFDFARREIAGQLGTELGARLRPLAASRWSTDPWALGAYSHALPGHSEDRAILAAPVGDRLRFAGEACSRRFFSTAHGAYETGIAAARSLLAAQEKAG